MKMIYVASLATTPDRDSGWIREFKKIGWDAIEYSTLGKENCWGIVGKLQRRFHWGSANRNMKAELLRLVEDVSPHWVHFRLPIEFDRNTILALKKRGTIITQYFNDDAFSPKTPIGLHWRFKHALTAYDAHFVYRAHNVESYRNAGADFVEHCPPAYDPGKHALIPRNLETKFLADAAFIGHWENDCRVEYLSAFYEAGLDLILKGGMWDRAIRYTPLKELSPVSPVFGVEYNRTYANVIAGLCFFSNVNNDNWTERALEIVAVGGVLVCERTEEAQSYFIDRKEACFFSSANELITIVKELKNDPVKRECIRAAGYQRLLSSKTTVHDRVLQIDHFVRSRLSNPSQS